MMNTDSAGKLVHLLLDDAGEALSDLPRVEGYTLIQEIGRGGGGVVYEGIADATGKAVAVKILRSRKSKSLMHALLEMDRLVEVRSSVVPHVYEHGWTDGRLYIVTEFIHGVSPIAYAEGLDVRGRVELLAKIANAVGVINERGVIHRDLKPSNVLVTSEGNPVILDLGISVAAKLDGEELTGSDGKPIGTLAYMAPEQARGENDGISTRWDVYALGAIGYRLLTGSTPHELPESITMGVRHVGSEQARSPRELNPNLPKPLSVVLEKACAWEAEDRYESAQLFRDDLRHWLNREPVTAGPQGAWTRSIRLAVKHPVLSMIGFAAMIFVFTIVSTVGAVWWMNMQPYEFRWAGGTTAMSTTLISRSLRPLHKWDTGVKDGIRFPGQILEGDDGGYAVIGFNLPDLETGVKGLVGFRLGEYEEPAWVAEQRVPEELSYAVGYSPPPHLFQCWKIYIEDVFPDIDGNELISLYRQQPNSVSAIQVHRINGELLSEHYHDGYVQSAYWHQASKKLIVTAVNSDGTWLDRGEQIVSAEKYPFVVYAFRPQVGQRGVAIHHPGLRAGVEPVWYRCLLPSSAYWSIPKDINGELRIMANQPGRLNQQYDGLIDLQIGNSPRGDHAGLTIDPDGNVVDSNPTDGWMQNTGLGPDDFYLGELPPRIIQQETEE